MSQVNGISSQKIEMSNASALSQPAALPMGGQYRNDLSDDSSINSSARFSQTIKNVTNCVVERKQHTTVAERVKRRAYIVAKKSIRLAKYCVSLKEEGLVREALGKYKVSSCAMEKIIPYLMNLLCQQDKDHYDSTLKTPHAILSKNLANEAMLQECLVAAAVIASNKLDIRKIYRPAYEDSLSEVDFQAVDSWGNIYGIDPFELPKDYVDSLHGKSKKKQEVIDKALQKFISGAYSKHVDHRKFSAQFFLGELHARRTAVVGVLNLTRLTDSQVNTVRQMIIKPREAVGVGCVLYVDRRFDVDTIDKKPHKAIRRTIVDIADVQRKQAATTRYSDGVAGNLFA